MLAYQCAKYFAFIAIVACFKLRLDPAVLLVRYGNTLFYHCHNLYLTPEDYILPDRILCDERVKVWRFPRQFAAPAPQPRPRPDPGSSGSGFLARPWGFSLWAGGGGAQAFFVSLSLEFLRRCWRFYFGDVLQARRQAQVADFLVVQFQPLPDPNVGG